jgi:hypothetical protein
MHLWYVSTPFEVVRVFDGPEEEDDGTLTERPRPLVAVDFGHAVWIEYVDGDDEDIEDGRCDLDGGDAFEGDDNTMETPTGAMPTTPTLADSDPKRLRFVTFPPFAEDTVTTSVSETKISSQYLPPPPSTSSSMSHYPHRVNSFPRGVVHTLPTPPELQLGLVETINIDQSQGAVILSDKGGKIWILCYE